MKPTAGQSRVSCIIPAHNAARYLGEAIESILRQSLPAHEVVVVDDGSTDRTRSVVLSFGPPVRYLYQEQSGAPAARNRGILASDGEVIAFLDADDRWRPEKLTRQMSRLSSDPSLGAVTSLLQNFWDRDLDRLIAELPESKRQPFPSFGFSTMLVRRAFFQQVGLLDTRQTHSDAFEWMLRARALGIRVEVLPEVLAERRLHHHNMSRTGGPANRQEHLALLKRELDRRRAPVNAR